MNVDDRGHCVVTGKLPYLSQRAATASRGKKRNRGARMRAYFCTHCHGWHLTTQPYSAEKVGKKIARAKRRAA